MHRVLRERWGGPWRCHLLWTRRTQPCDYFSLPPLGKSVARTIVGDAVVSTVYLCLDHSYGLAPRPLVFETMVFTLHGDELRPYLIDGLGLTLRCTYEREARIMHRVIARLVAAYQAP